MPLSGFGVARLEHAAAAFAFSSGMAGGSELWIGGDSNPIDRRSLCLFLGVVKVRNEIGWRFPGFPLTHYLAVTLTVVVYWGQFEGSSRTRREFESGLCGRNLSTFLRVKFEWTTFLDVPLSFQVLSTLLPSGLLPCLPPFFWGLGFRFPQTQPKQNRVPIFFSPGNLLGI